MKYFFFILAFGLFAFTCGRVDKGSVFLYMPESLASLKANGYQSEKESNLYWKAVGDTTEHLDVGNLDSAQFTKSFWIRLKSKDTVRLAEFLIQNADSVFLHLDHNIFVQIKGKLFFIVHGQSTKKTIYLVSYRNIARFRDKVQAVNDLKSDLTHYTDTSVRLSIMKALDRIDKNWKNFPVEYYEGPPPPSESHRN